MKFTYTKALILIAVICSALFAYSAQAFAADEVVATPIPSTSRNENRCETAQKKIGSRVSMYRGNRGIHKDKFAVIKNKIASIVERLKAKGYDTSILEADLATLQEKINTFSANADAFITKLEATNDYNCGQSAGAFLQNLNETKDLAKAARQSATEVRSYIRETIKTDILNIKKQK